MRAATPRVAVSAHQPGTPQRGRIVAASPMNAAAVPASTSGYLIEIGSLQCLHLPRSHSHARTGTLSTAVSSALQDGQKDPGLTTDMCLGVLNTTTFRKDPR